MENETSNYTVAIVDDHALFAGSLEKLINSFPNFTTLFHLGNGLELQKKLRQIDEIPDIILLDINMPVLNGLETAEWLSSTHPNIQFLALTMEDDEKNILRMIRAGAKGYLLKDIEPNELNMALNEVMKKGYYHSEKVSEALLHSLENQKDNKPLDFKEHEIEFIQFASSEMTYKEIADVMGVSPKTVDGYRQGLFNRLNIKNGVGLVMFALKHNIIEL